MHESFFSEGKIGKHVMNSRTVFGFLFLCVLVTGCHQPPDYYAENPYPVGPIDPPPPYYSSLPSYVLRTSEDWVAWVKRCNTWGTEEMRWYNEDFRGGSDYYGYQNIPRQRWNAGRTVTGRCP